ncbi:MAG TPA: cyclase family protein [Streptosporangiaceae bacterium]|nr:cyclase family protein [Streptosporangiaceae bacterium]
MPAQAPFGFSKVVFLSHVITKAMPVFPGDSAITIEPAATIDRDGYYLQRVAFGEQSGTHWAAAAHFSPGEKTADQLDAGDFFLRAVVLDHRAEAAADPDFAVAVSDLRRWEAEHGAVPARSAVLLMTGFDRRWPDQAGYLGADESGVPHYPGFSGQAARWLVEQRDIAALGADTMGIDQGADATFAANRALLRSDRMHLENLRGLDQLPPTGAWIVVGGLRIARGSGSPATIFGLIP